MPCPYVGLAIDYIDTDNPTGAPHDSDVPMSPERDDLGYNAVLILSAFAAGARYGLEAIERTGLSSGTVYPALRRLEAAGLLAAEWEDEGEAHDDGRPARRYYRMTGEGETALAEARERIHARQRALGWADGGVARG